MTAWRERARKLRQDVVAVALAMRDPRVPWHARALGVCIVAYALSPIDLIPDFIPIIGYLDDLILVPLGIYLVIRLIPEHVIVESRTKADLWIARKQERPRNYLAADVIVLVWLAVAYGAWTLLAV